MRWPEGLQGWPLAEHSRRIPCKPHRWHVQEMGEGPLILLLHGAGGACHSWRHVAPRLATSHRVVALDLPGHGLTQLGTRTRSGLTAMTEDILALCDDQGWRAETVIGHSAGGAVALRMAQLAPDRVQRVVGINAALSNFPGLAGIAFPIMAKMLALTPFTADFFSRAADEPGRIDAILDGTGSKIDAETRDLYRRLVGDRDHVDGALLMMAQWSLNGLLADLPNTRAQVFLLSAENDGTVPPETARSVSKRLNSAASKIFPGFGHLIHEEAPDIVARSLLDWLATQNANQLV